MNSLFYNDELLEKYEQHQQWDKCIEHLLMLIKQSPYDKSLLFRLAAESWYVLTFWDCDISNNELDRTSFETSLKTAYYLSKEKTWANQDCLWLFGYFMAVNQTVFTFISENFIEIEQYGNELIRKAYFENPNNKLAEILYFADNGNNRKYKNTLKITENSIYRIFPSNSVIDQYFIEIFSNIIS